MGPFNIVLGICILSYNRRRTNFSVSFDLCQGLKCGDPSFQHHFSCLLDLCDVVHVHCIGPGIELQFLFDASQPFFQFYAFLVEMVNLVFSF